MKTFGVGIIGFGFIGKMHAYGYLNMPLFYDPVPLRTRLVGVATSRPETARKAAEQGGFEFGTDNWRELVERDDIQIINICSPNEAHCEQLLAAMQAGKHIYCDKPLVTTDEEAAAVSSALGSYGGTGQMTLNYRFLSATLRAAQLIGEGFLGNIIGFRAAYLHAGNIETQRPLGWRQLGGRGEGVLQDLGSHVLDLIDYLAGPVVEVCAEDRVLYDRRRGPDGEMRQVEAEDQVVMLARLENGALGTIEVSKIATGSEDDLRFELHGDKGGLRFNLMDTNYLEAYDLREKEMPLGGQRGWRRIACVQRYEKPAVFPSPKSSIGWTRGHLHCLYNFLEAIAAGRKAEPGLERGLELQRLLAGVERSVRERNWQRL